MVTKQNLIAKFDAKFLASHSKFPNRKYLDLSNYLKSNTFFDEPAARGHHNNFPGGLAQHVLNFTHTLETLIESFDGRIKISKDEYDPFLVAIGHDLNKVGFYKIVDVNKKVGSQWHNLKGYGYNSDLNVLPGNSMSLGRIEREIQISPAESLSIFWAEGPWSTYKDQNLDKAWKNAINHDNRVYLAHTADMITSQMMEATLNDFDVDKAIREWK